MQTAVDAKHKLIVAETVTNAAGDRDQLSALATAAQEILPAPAPVVVADQGYYSHHHRRVRSQDQELSDPCLRPLCAEASLHPQ